ncbi:MAG: hypothetical protein WDA21_01350 [Bacilli bacterium]
MNKLVKVLIIIVTFLLIFIVGLLWWFVFKDESNDLDIVSNNEIEEALNYFNNYNDVFAAKVLIDYCNEDVSFLNDKECNGAFKKYSLYNEDNAVALELLSYFIDDTANIKSEDEMNTIIDLWNQISINGDDLIYLYSKISREKVIKGYKLVDTMNKTKNQKALINFKDYYKSSRLNDFEKYSIYLYMIEMPDLLADTKIVYNNKKISFDSFLESEDIYHETFNVINNFYKKVNIKK